MRADDYNHSESGASFRIVAREQTSGSHPDSAGMLFTTFVVTVNTSCLHKHESHLAN